MEELIPFLILILVLILVFLVLLLLLVEAFRERVRIKPASPLSLLRHEGNPILSHEGHVFWESEAVFNPAVFYGGERVHLFYRAIGGDGVSRLGYATGIDGVHFTRRSSFPAYELSKEHYPEDKKTIPRAYHPGLYASGGSWGGIEDPRVVCIDDHVYMTFTAFMGWDAVRVALTSLPHTDLLNLEWRWRRPSFISPPGQVHKNWVLFPEKVGDRYAVLHSISPRISIHYADSLEDLFADDMHIESRYERDERKGAWDTWVRGVGPPPIKTDDGWLLLYHAINKDELDRYKIGAMLLDLDNPEKVLHRSRAPLLCPDTDYENDGKPGVVYATGAVVIGDTLHVYYGGGDKTVNVATAPLKQFLCDLKRG